MPRKTDGIEFEIHPRPTKGEDGKPLLYVRPAKGRKKNFKDLEDFCNKYRNLCTGELQMVFDVVIDVVGLWLSDGYRVETPIGSFAPKLKLLGEHTDPKNIHGRDIEYAGIEFIPSKEFFCPYITLLLIRSVYDNVKGYFSPFYLVLSEKHRIFAGRL